MSDSLVFSKRWRERNTHGVVFFIDFNGGVNEPSLSRVKHINYIHFKMPVYEEWSITFQHDCIDN